MPLQFILGKPGTGKTTHCLNEINKRLDEHALLYYIVPEQFSLQSERLILGQRAAATTVQVLSFNRLAYRLFASLGGPPGKIADDLGKQMLLRKVIFDAGNDLVYYKSAANKLGFVDALLETVTEMAHYKVTGDSLKERIDDSTPAFAGKLNDIATISKAYRGMVDEKYIMTEDMLDILYEKINTSEALPLLDNAYFWVDGFSGFTPQELHVLGGLLKRAAGMYITLTTTSDSLLSTPVNITQEKLTAIAKGNLLPTIMLEENHRHQSAKGLAAFVENFKVYKKLPEFSTHEGISIISAPNKNAEVNATANEVLKLTAKGYQFKNIAILCGDKSAYEKLLQTTFDRLNIPLFIDSEIEILSHPLTELIRSAIDVLATNWSYESVFRLLKTGLTGSTQNDKDILENYVLEKGIASYRWRYKFSDPRAEAARQKLLTVIPKAKPRDTVFNFSKLIFNMLYELNVPQTLDAWYKDRMHAGDIATANLHKQIWPKISQVFDKLAEMLGIEKVSIKEYAAVLDAGLNQVSLGRVPPTTNQVILGDVARSRYPEIDVMIVLGATENALPPPLTQKGLLSEIERKLLANTGLELGKENTHRLADSYYSLYVALSQPKEKLILIYPQADRGGKPLRPAAVVTRVQEMFPDIKTVSAEVFAEFGEMEPRVQSTGMLLNADSVYDKNIHTTPSRLESFAKCPFQYFMTYTLQAKERKRFEVLPTDLGNLYHTCLAEFSKEVWQNGKKEMTKNEIQTLVTDLIAKNIKEDDAFNDTARNRYVITRARQMLTASIWALNEHLRAGEFSPKFAEHRIIAEQGITLDSGKTLHLGGIVDRVDSFFDGKDEYIKVIDYKSGNVKFDTDEVKQGVQLQLMIYMNMLAESLKAKPGGIFYFPISDPIIDMDDYLPDRELEAGLLKQFKMSGIALGEESTLAALDKNLTAGVGSNVIPVAINKDGSYKKTSKPVVLDLESFTALGKEVEEKVKELGNRMTKGDVTVAPYTTGVKAPCRFCKFDGVCGINC